MPTNTTWVVEAKLIKDTHQEKVIILLHCENEAMCKDFIQHYQQVNQIRLTYHFLPLPLQTYTVRHGEVAGLVEQSKQLSQDNPVILFFPDDYQIAESSQPCLAKNVLPIRRFTDDGTPLLHAGVPDKVANLLWEPDSAVKCYAIIHAAKSFWFPSDFHDEEIHSACLYQGEMAEQYEATAPYLLELPQKHNLVKKLFSENLPDDKDGFNHWGKNAVIFFRSKASFGELLAHFRRFIYMRTYDERLLYFRFYDPVVLENYLDIITNYPNKLATFFGGDLINAFSVGLGDNFIDYVPSIDLSEVEPAPNQFDKLEMQIFIDQYDNKLLRQVGENLIKDFPNLTKQYDEKAIHQAVRENFELAKRHNIVLTGSIYLFTAYQLFLGKPVNELDEQGIITQILNGDADEHKKIEQIKQRINQLEAQQLVTPNKELL